MASAKERSNYEEKFFLKTLTDVENGIFEEEWTISNNELNVGEEWRIEKRTLHGGLSEDVDIVTINNGKLIFIVVPTRGFGIWKGEYKGTFLGWASPVRDLVHPHYINLEARGGLGWLDGFNEWIVRCGINYLGASGIDTIIDNMGRKKNVILTLHGRIANIPASLVRVRIGLDPPYEIGLEGIICERSMFGSNLQLTTSITTLPGSNWLRISDTIENLRGITDEIQLIYHCNYGSPFLEEGSRLLAPIKCIAPRDLTAVKDIGSFDVFGPPDHKFIEQVFFLKLLGDQKGRTKVMLVNKDKSKAVSISFSLKDLPFFTLWKNTASLKDGYVVGLEPGTSFPNQKSFERERGRVIKLRPHESYRTDIILSTYLDKDEISKAIEEIENFRGKVQPTVLQKPVQDYTPV